MYLSSCILLQDDGKLDKLSSFLGFGKVDHYAEVTDKTAMIEVDSPQTGRVRNRIRAVEPLVWGPKTVSSHMQTSPKGTWGC